MATAALPATAAGEDEELFLLGFVKSISRRLSCNGSTASGFRAIYPLPWFDASNDVGVGRIADMDAADIDIQVLSAMTPGAQT